MTNEITLKQLVDIINQETLTREEKALEQGITLDGIKKRIRAKTLIPLRPKATVLFTKDKK